MNELDFDRGYKCAYDNVMRLILREAVIGDTERWRLERNAAVAILREVCEAHGDNDWPDDLHLRDVIDKHLWQHLEAAK